MKYWKSTGSRKRRESPENDIVLLFLTIDFIRFAKMALALNQGQCRMQPSSRSRLPVMTHRPLFWNVTLN